MNLTDLAVSGPLLLAGLLALTAGAVSFASRAAAAGPRYLAYLAGLVGAQPAPVPTADGAARSVSGRWRVAGATALLVLGFTVVFATATLAVLGLTDALLLNEQLLQRLGGVITITMGLVFLEAFPVLQRGMLPRHTPRDGLWGAPLLGAVYGLGWTPCLGPTLAGVIALASGTQVGPTTGRGLLLIGAHCLGLGLPFILLALGHAGPSAPPPGSAATSGWYNKWAGSF